NDAAFYTANDEGSVVYFAQLISRTGSYLSKAAGVPEGTSMAYLIAPPMEAIMGLDAAVKSSGAQIALFYGPPTETNFAGGLLVGEQSQCQDACETFAATVRKIAASPLEY
ncbi:MAG: microcompartment protein EutL, partial [Firmicutes bacterium]|nr:microcompartment protein EutL [Bacillota bacterium]